MNEKKSRKEWVKSFAIVFLSVLLVLTFFSNTIRNYSLPEVAAQYTNQGTITNKVRGQGMVDAQDPYSVVFKQSRKVGSVNVRVGDAVEKGDVLFFLEEGESEELKQAQDTLASLQAAYEKSLITGQISTSVSNAVEKGTAGNTASNQARITSIKTRIEKYEKEIENLEKQINNWTYGDVSTIPEKKAAADAKTTLDAWNAQLEITTKNISAVETRLSAFISTYSDYSDLDSIKSGLSTMKSAVDTAKSAVTAAQTDVDNNPEDADLISVLNSKKAEYDGAKSKYDTAVKLCEDYPQRYLEHNTATTQQPIAQNNYANAQKVVDNKIEELNNLKNIANVNLTASREELSELVETLTTQISLSEALDEIKKQKELIEKLEGEQVANEIVAPVTGTVMSLNYVAGETIDTGSTVATIQVAGKGFTLTMNVTNEQAALLKPGDEAEVINSWWYTDVHARIISIRPNAQNPQAGKIVTFELEGDVTNGQTLSLSVGQRSATYDCIVPNSAIREDNKGKFVYRVVSKSSPLGTRYSVERVDVKVLAEEDTQSAISGALDNWEYIVTTSSKPLTDGQLIRLKNY